MYTWLFTSRLTHYFLYLEYTIFSLSEHLFFTNVQTMPGFIKVLTVKDIPGKNSVYVPPFSIMPEEVSTATVVLMNAINILYSFLWASIKLLSMLDRQQGSY